MNRAQFDSANAMRSGWGEYEEFYCIPCTMEEIRDYHDGDTEYFLESAHRGGFVPVIVDGASCGACGATIGGNK